MGIREYILSVTAAAIVAGCISSFFKDVKLICILCGIFVSIAVFKPILDFDLEYHLLDIQAFSLAADEIVEEAFQSTEDSQKNIIKNKTETYICDKASEIGCQIAAEVFLAELAPYQPIKIRIEGDVSPYAKKLLQNVIEIELGVPLEDQQWNR